MPTLRLITSCSQRRLLDTFAEAMADPPLPPLEKEHIVILSNGMARWISMGLAERSGVSAGLEFSFPNDFLDRCFKSILSEPHSSTHFTHSSLTWRIAAQLPALSQQDGFEQVASYLGDGSDDRRLLQLSRTLADCFDQYTIFRPEMILAWDNGTDDQWQAKLWRMISGKNTGGHRAALLKTLQDHAAGGNPPAGELPRRVTLFGISYLPPFHLEALRLLSAYCDVTCYLLNPCGLYWGQLLSEKKKSFLALSDIPRDAEEYYDTGNPLLSSFGTLGQEFFESLLDYGFETEELDSGGTASSPTLLAAIQNDIFTLKNRRKGQDKGIVAADDRSLQIHSCHGIRREMEILHDNLLSHLDELPGLEPRHIIVMIPDIESYAPYISSVFGSRTTGRPPLPYTIADRSVRRESVFIDAFTRVLELSASRMALHDMLDLLDIPVVRNRFRFSEDELVTVRGWLADCGVRWGFDGGHRAELGFPGYDDFSWQAGLDRLFLGYAMSPDDSATFGGILPYPACSGRQSETLGKLAEYITAVRESSARLSGRRTLPEWADILASVVSRMLLPDESEAAGALVVAKALNTLRDASARYGFRQTIALDAVSDHLIEALTGSGGGYGFMGGSITFCAMLPMRSIPMRVVWLAGMNDGQFPRTRRHPGFSLMNGIRQRGDRSLRDEDRYLFLEALMAAEDRLCISYNGQSDRDNSTLPPSVLVAELLDYVTNGFTASDGTTPADVLVRHRLQGFSPHYFDGQDPGHLFSYDSETCRALEAGRVSGRSRHRFMNEPLPLDDTADLHIDLHQLRRFLANPAAAFLEQRLRVRPYNPAEEPEESEPFSLDTLTRYNLSQELIERILEGVPYDQCLAAARSRGVLPPLSAGRTAFDAAWARSRQFAATLEPQLGTPLEALTVMFSGNGVQLHAVLENCRSELHLRWRPAGMKGRDRLTIWLDHLLLNIAKADGYPRQSMMISNDATLTLPPLDNAPEIMTDLLDLYRKGMTRPLPFFPETSWVFLKDGMSKTERAWRGDQRMGIPGEQDNQAVALCFNSEEPLGEEFKRLAERVYGPLIAVWSNYI